MRASGFISGSDGWFLYGDLSGTESAMIEPMPQEDGCRPCDFAARSIFTYAECLLFSDTDSDTHDDLEKYYLLILTPRRAL